MAVFVGTGGNDTFSGANDDNVYFFTPATLQSSDLVTGGTSPFFTDFLTFTASGTIAASALSGVTNVEWVVLADSTIDLTLTDSLVTGSNRGFLQITDVDGASSTVRSGDAGVDRKIFFFAGDGNDTLVGGVADETVVFTVASNLTAADSFSFDGGGDWMIFQNNGVVLSDAFAGVSGVEVVKLNNGGTLQFRDGMFGAIAYGFGSEADDSFDASQVTDRGIGFLTGTGNDTIVGSSQSDRIHFVDAAEITAQDVITGGAGFDQMVIYSGTGQADAFAQTSSVETLIIGSSGDVTLTLLDSLSSIGIVVATGDFNVVLDAHTLANNPLLYFATGAFNAVISGAQNDAFWFKDGLTLDGDALRGGGGYDYLVLETNTSYSTADTQFVQSVEEIQLRNGGSVAVNDDPVGSADNQHVTIRGSAATDTLDASAVAVAVNSVTLYSEGGADNLLGGAGDDVIVILDGNYAQVDGNGNFDILQLAGNNATLDLTAVAGKTTDIEAIDMRGAGGNVLTLDDPAVTAVTGGGNNLWIVGDFEDDVILDGWSFIADNLTEPHFPGHTFTQIQKNGVNVFLSADLGPIDFGNEGPLPSLDTVTTPEDTSITIPASQLLANDIDPEGNPITIVSVDSAVNGTVALDINGDIVFTPAPDFNGEAQFSYTIQDNQPGTSTATGQVFVTVTPVDDLPIAVDDTLTVAEDSGNTIGDLTPNDTPSGDGGNLWAIGTGPANGVAGVSSLGTFVYRPNADFNGTDTFTYTITDANGSVSTATVTISVTPVNDLPVAVDDAVSTDEDTPVNGNVSTNDTDLGDTPVSFALTTDGTHGSALVNASGTFSYTPDADFHGSDSFTYTVTDANGDTSTATVSVTINSVNDLPVAVDDAVSTDEDTPVNGNVSTNDTDLGDTPVSFALTTDGTHGSALVNASGTFSYTPDADFHGSDSFTYTVTDANGDTSTATVSVTINSVNDLPVAVDDAVSTDEDTPVNGNVSTNDTDLGDTPVSFALTTDGTHGSALVNASGTFSYTPDADFHGSDSFTYTVTDANGDTSTATVSVTINSVNDLPVAVDDAVSTDEDTPVNGNVSTNDTDLGDTPVSFALTTDGTHGSALVNASGTFSYTPDADFHGSDSFTYTVTDANGDTSTATVSVTINSVNDLPVAVDDAVSTDEDTPVNGNVSTNDTDLGDTPVSFALTTDGTHGSALVNASGTFSYTPDADFHGSDSFTYTVTDANGDTSTATVSVTINSVNDLPVAVDDAVSTDEDTPVNGNVSTNDTDLGDTPVSFALTTDGTHGSALVNASGTFSYTPDADFHGSDSFTYTVTDANGDTSTATVSVTINSVNDLPVAVDDAVSTDEETPVNGDVSTNDTDLGDTPVSFALTTDGTHGSALVNANGTFSYTPDADFHGSDSFTYTVTDANGDTSTATVSVTINSVNDLPVAVDDAVSTDEDTPVNGNVSTNDTDLGDTPVSFALTTDGTHGSALVNASGTFSYTPDADFHGSDSFTYTVTDANGDTSTATVSVTINSVNDLPVAVDDAVSTDEDTPVNGNVSTNDTDLGDTPVSFALTTDGTHGSALVNASGTFSYTPDADFHGSDSFTYTVTDANGDTSTATVSVTINSVNDLPVAVDDAVSTNEETPVNGDVSTNDTDLGDTPVSFALTTDGTHGSALVNANGTFTYTPDTDFFGADSFTYTVTDANGDTSTATVSVTVNNLNDPPVATTTHNWMSSDPAQQNPGFLNGYPLLVSIPTDIDGDQLTVTANDPVPAGVFYDNDTGPGVNYVALTAGTVLYGVGVNFLDDLVYQPTAAVNDLVNVVLSLNVSDGTAPDVTQTVEIHEVQSVVPTQTEFIGSLVGGPLNSGHGGDEPLPITVNADLALGTNLNPNGSSVVLYTDFQKAPFDVDVPADEQNPTTFDANDAGSQREGELQAEIHIGSNKFVIVERDGNAGEFEQSWFFDAATGLMRAGVTFDHVFLLDSNGDPTTTSLGDFLTDNPASAGDTWTLIFSDNDGGSFQARLLRFDFFTSPPDSPGITVVSGTGTATDQIYGTPGGDVLFGGDGDDFIEARAGKDVLIGGSGADQLSGGAGPDTFKYLAITDSQPGATDTIEDFSHVDDLIDFSAIAGINVAGSPAGGIGQVAANSVSWIEVGSETIVYANSTALADHVDLEIHLTGIGLNLASNDFLLA